MVMENKKENNNKKEVQVCNNPNCFNYVKKSVDDDNKKDKLTKNKISNIFKLQSVDLYNLKNFNILEDKLFKEDQVKILNDWLIANVKNPYASYEVKKELSVKTNLSIKQIKQWLVNHRRKLYR